MHLKKITFTVFIYLFFTNVLYAFEYPGSVCPSLIVKQDTAKGGIEITDIQFPSPEGANISFEDLLAKQGIDLKSLKPDKNGDPSIIINNDCYPEEFEVLEEKLNHEGENCDSPGNGGMLGSGADWASGISNSVNQCEGDGSAEKDIPFRQCMKKFFGDGKKGLKALDGCAKKFALAGGLSFYNSLKTLFVDLPLLLKNSGYDLLTEDADEFIENQKANAQAAFESLGQKRIQSFLGRVKPDNDKLQALASKIANDPRLALGNFQGRINAIKKEFPEVSGEDLETINGLLGWWTASSGAEDRTADILAAAYSKADDLYQGKVDWLKSKILDTVDELNGALQGGLEFSSQMLGFFEGIYKRSTELYSCVEFEYSDKEFNCKKKGNPDCLSCKERFEIGCGMLGYTTGIFGGMAATGGILTLAGKGINLGKSALGNTKLAQSGKVQSFAGSQIGQMGQNYVANTTLKMKEALNKAGLPYKTLANAVTGAAKKGIEAVGSTSQYALTTVRGRASARLESMTATLAQIPSWYQTALHSAAAFGSGGGRGYMKFKSETLKNLIEEKSRQWGKLDIAKPKNNTQKEIIAVKKASLERQVDKLNRVKIETDLKLSKANANNSKSSAQVAAQSNTIEATSATSESMSVLDMVDTANNINLSNSIGRIEISEETLITKLYDEHVESRLDDVTNILLSETDKAAEGARNMAINTLKSTGATDYTQKVVGKGVNRFLVPTIERTTSSVQRATGIVKGVKGKAEKIKEAVPSGTIKVLKGAVFGEEDE